MAIQKGTESLTLTKEERTWRVECFAEEGTDYSIIFHRETLWKRTDGTIAQRDRRIPLVLRSKSMLQTSGDTGISLLEALRDLGDKWAAEDAAKEKLQ